MCNENNNQNNCLAKSFESILMLQHRGEECDEDNTCTRPFLGPTLNVVCLNTRPINLYSCCNNILWTMPFTLNGTTDTSSVFRIENIEDECATFRVLAPNPDTTSIFPYVATEDFFTIRLSCIGAIKCLGDTSIAGV